jgi:DNA-repair protein XRCC3
LQLSLTVQLNETLGGLSKDAVYIFTEGRFPIERLTQLANSFAYRNSLDGFGDHQFENQIYVKQIYDIKALMHCVAVDLPNLCRSKNIGIVIIDSIAAPLRCETNYQLRADQMRTIVHELLKLSGKYHCAIVCVNQVCSFINPAVSVL